MVLSDFTTGGAVEPDGTSLGHVLDTVGAPALQMLNAMPDRQRIVRSTLLHDPADPLPDGADTMLLGAGVTIDTPEGLLLVRQAIERGYPAVVVKRRGADAAALAAEATEASLALLLAADEIPWRRLDALILSVLATRGIDGETLSGAGDELFAVANGVAAVIGGSVAIEDLERNVLAYSSLANQRMDDLRRQGILDRRVPAMGRHLAQYGAVLAAGRVVRFTSEEVGTARAAIAIRAGDQPLGTIWAIEGPDGLQPQGERALADAARLAALHLLRRRNASELGIHARDAALRSAIEGHLAPHEVAFRLSVPADADVALLGFTIRSDLDDSGPLVAQLGTALTRYFSVFRADAAVATSARAVYVLVSRVRPDAAMRLAEGAVGSLSPGLGQHVRAAVTERPSPAQDLPAMRAEVDDVLRVTAVDSDLPRVATLAQVRSRVLVTHVADAIQRLPRLRHPGVEAMLEHDRSHRTEFAPSVRAWLDAASDVGSAANSLGVHGNTLRYRLRRAEALFGFSLQNPDDRLAVWVHLRADLHGTLRRPST
jgi:hypothetical protein